jgi:glycosyltransferase involved in cell wall biosynthesis
VDTERFRPIEKSLARKALNIPEGTKVLLSVGGLVPRKGYHRIIDLLPDLIDCFDDIIYIVVGGATVEGDFSHQLHELVNEKRLHNHARFEGSRPPDQLPAYYSAADLIVLPTSNEGWANVFLESLACGTPVVTTDVGGNREVIANQELGIIVPPEDSEALFRAIKNALHKDWDPGTLIRYAGQQTWGKVAESVVAVFQEVSQSSA